VNRRFIPLAALIVGMTGFLSGWNSRWASAQETSAAPPAAATEEAAIAETPTPLHAEIDRLIRARTPDYDTLAAPLASDGEFLRRVSLDLTGLLPSITETRAFLSDADPAKREKLVNRLLAHPSYPRHMQRTFDVVLMRRLSAKHVPTPAWETFLRTSFAEDKGYDQIVREILAADGTDPNVRGRARFLLDRDGDSHEITRDVARIFLGANLDCAQCHDHPSVDGFKQAHYYGIQAFVVRSFLFTDEKKVAMMAEKAEGEVTFESVFEIRDKKSSGPKSLTPQIFEKVSFTEPKFDKGQEYVVAPDPKKKEVRPIPKFSRRAHLADAVASRDNRRFARTAVNRVWSILFARGLVHPVDMDHAANPPSHPELLDLLTDEFMRNRFDVRWLLKEIVLSSTYQRSSQRPVGADGKAEFPPEAAFAQAQVRPLSPAQFAWAYCEATGEATLQARSFGDKLTEELLQQRMAGYETQFVNRFGGQPGKPIENLEATIDQALWLSNDAGILSLLNVRNGSLSDRLLKLPADNPAAIAEELYLSALVRMPTAQEVQDVADYLKDLTAEARANAAKELVWALTMSSEFRVVH
jgi:hypothetical protein